MAVVEPVVGEPDGVGDPGLRRPRSGLGSGSCADGLAGRCRWRASQLTGPSCGCISACIWPISAPRSSAAEVGHAARRRTTPKICSKGVPLNGFSALSSGSPGLLPASLLMAPSYRATATRTYGCVGDLASPDCVRAVRLVAIRDDAARRRRGDGRGRGRAGRRPRRCSSARSATTTAARTSTGLEYSAHPTAARPAREVAAEVADEYDVSRVAAVHRVGALAIGDIAVVVAVSAAHRGEAFDGLPGAHRPAQGEVPIWKHQLFADGTEEWVGTP